MKNTKALGISQQEIEKWATALEQTPETVTKAIYTQFELGATTDRQAFNRALKTLREKPVEEGITSRGLYLQRYRDKRDNDTVYLLTPTGEVEKIRANDVDTSALTMLKSKVVVSGLQRMQYTSEKGKSTYLVANDNTTFEVDTTIPVSFKTFGDVQNEQIDWTKHMVISGTIADVNNVWSRPTDGTEPGKLPIIDENNNISVEFVIKDAAGMLGNIRINGSPFLDRLASIAKTTPEKLLQMTPETELRELREYLLNTPIVCYGVAHRWRSRDGQKNGVRMNLGYDGFIIAAE